MKRASVALVLIYSLWLVFVLGVEAGDRILRLATTTSTDNTGLLDYLAPLFEKQTGIKLQWVAVGTGKALKLGQNCDVDLLLVHAPPAEKVFIAKGYGLERRPIMYNDFVLVGPPADPARIRGLPVKEAFRRLAAKGARFVSRGDNSGTHQKELSLWQAAGLSPAQLERKPWYLQTGQGMMITLLIAAEKGAYTLTDRGTFLKFKANHKLAQRLAILVEGDPALRNQYSVILVNPARCPNVKAKQARLFIEWLTSPEIQRKIGEFKLFGQPLFIPNAHEETGQ